jgi:SAM-dependent methyltransferase
MAAGGFARDHGGIHFFTRVNALMSPNMTVLDFGAGRGAAFNSQVNSSAFYHNLVKLQGKVERVIGIDVDDGINDHPYLDARHIVDPLTPLPLEAECIDLVVADWVLEHVAHPEIFASEMLRILKPGGWLCARTVNRWGYVGIGTRLIPNSVHKSLLRRIWPERFEVDVFPTTYRLNTISSLRRYFPDPKWDNFSYLNNATPKYFGRSATLFRLIHTYQKLVPYFLSTDLLVFLQKRQ